MYFDHDLSLRTINDINDCPKLYSQTSMLNSTHNQSTLRYTKLLRVSQRRLDNSSPQLRYVFVKKYNWAMSIWDSVGSDLYGKTGNHFDMFTYGTDTVNDTVKLSRSLMGSVAKTDSKPSALQHVENPYHTHEFMGVPQAVALRVRSSSDYRIADNPGIRPIETFLIREGEVCRLIAYYFESCRSIPLGKARPWDCII